MMQTRISDIEWDTDGETVDLPKEVVIDLAAEGVTDPEMEIPDWLSDKYGWCVSSFNHAPADEAELQTTFTPNGI